MSTDPREFEHPIDGTGGNVTQPLVDVIAEVLADTPYENLEDCARAVLDAIEQAGAVEWGVFRITDAPVMLPFDEAKFTTKTAAEVFIKLGFLERVAKTLEPRSRITGPWKRAE